MKKSVIALWVLTSTAGASQGAVQPDSASMHPVGSCYQGGVVFYVNPNPNAPVGQRGLIAATKDASVTCSGAYKTCFWDHTGKTVPSNVANATAYFTGAANTRALVSRYSAVTQAANAAAAYTGGGYSDWYLPARDELATLFFQTANMPNFGHDCAYEPPAKGETPYWSSSQTTLYAANTWYVSFGLGYVDYGSNTDFSCFVRPVRAF